MKIKVICGAIIVKRDKFVIVQEAQDRTRGTWGFPAGHLHENENVLQATIREVKEETNLTVKLKGLVGVYQYKSKHGNNVVAFYFKASVVKGSLRCNPKEILDCRWVTAKEFLNIKDNCIRAPHLKQVMKDYIKQGAVEKRVFVSDF